MKQILIRLYSSGRVVLEGIRVDFWWHSPESMELVRPSTGDTWNNIAYFRIYVSLPWSDDYSQVFVLYQDGNMRLLNPTPHGLDWTPFGTSVIFGQTDVDDFRPAVSITKVEIEPEELTMKIIYSDGSSTDANLVPYVFSLKPTCMSSTKVKIWSESFCVRSTKIMEKIVPASPK
ncbi:hypothetical protein SNE40_001811 [Patella caerulea]|uniref:Uncharacterized protein n=2 Tax=Patella caerulea TaxID=87958 RepID=A0AAN8KB49_PATCE